MGGHDSYREALTSWAITTKETKGEGSDRHGELRIGQEVKYICNTLWGEVDMSTRTQDD